MNTREAASEADSHSLVELRCLHELARQLLPLASPVEVARDGLLCIAGITGIGAGAVLWRAGDTGPLELVSHFGLGPARLRQRYRVASRALRLLVDSGPLTLEAARRRPGGRDLAATLEPLGERIGATWILPLQGEEQVRGLLLLGPSLVTEELVSPASWLASLAEILRLGLLGRPLQRQAGARAMRSEPTPRGGGRARQASARLAASARSQGARGAAARLAALRRRHPPAVEVQGASPAVLGLLEEIVSLAGTDYAVLVEGETGTGKELAARLLHRLSKRARGPFEAVDCSAMPRELIESELFGHVKGAFTDARRDYRGAFERADGGTLLLDEVGDMDLGSQTRLLRVLQEGSVRRLGGDRPVHVDVRVVAATNRDLADLVRRGRFRDDLYYRIHVCLLRLPPLRQRGDDRLVLFESFMHQTAHELGRESRPLASESRRRLRAEVFPGNVRQLQNVVRQLLVQSSARGPVPLEELERVLERTAPRRPAVASAPGAEREDAHARRNPAGNTAAAATESGAGPPHLHPGADVEDVGGWVLEQLRAHRFNLLVTARHLQALRRLGATRAQVPVFDRGALDYHFCGEFYHRLVQRDFALEAVVNDMAGSPAFVPRLRRKAHAFLRPLAALAGRGRDSTAWRHSYRRLPERYHLDLEAVVCALHEGRWQLPAP